MRPKRPGCAHRSSYQQRDWARPVSRPLTRNRPVAAGSPTGDSAVVGWPTRHHTGLKGAVVEIVLSSGHDSNVVSLEKASGRYGRYPRGGEPGAYGLAWLRCVKPTLTIVFPYASRATRARPRPRGQWPGSCRTWVLVDEDSPGMASGGPAWSSLETEPIASPKGRQPNDH